MAFAGEPVWAADEKPVKKKEAKPLSVTQLAQLNSAALFGVPFKINKGRFSVTYPGAGEFDKAFTTRGRGRGGVIANISEVKNASCSFPDMKMIGRNAATVVRVLRVMARATSEAPRCAASSFGVPASR